MTRGLLGCCAGRDEVQFDREGRFERYFRRGLKSGERIVTGRQKVHQSVMIAIWNQLKTGAYLGRLFYWLNGTMHMEWDISLWNFQNFKVCTNRLEVKRNRTGARQFARRVKNCLTWLMVHE